MLNDLRKSIGNVMASTRRAGKELGDGIDALREQISGLKRERARIVSLPVSKEIAIARAEQWVSEAIGKGLEMAPSASRFAGSANWMPPPALPNMPLAMFVQDLMIEGARKMVSDYYAAGVPSISEQERRTQIAGVDQKIMDAELAEESVIRAAEAAGFPVLRRGDADPRAVLAHDKVLP